MSVSVPDLAAALQQVVAETPAVHARSSGFCQRRSKLSAAVFVQTLVLGWLANPAASLAELAMTAGERGVRISPQGLDQRFGPAAAAVLEAVLAAAVAQDLRADPDLSSALAGFSAVLVLDSTTVTLPDALAERWPGCGGRVAHQGRAALKATVRLALRSGRVEGPVLTPGRAQDKTSRLQRAPLPAGALRVADLGFWSLGAFAEIAAQDAYFLSRLHPQPQVRRAGETAPLALEAWLAAQPVDEAELAVRVGAQARVPARLLALRVPPALAHARAERIRERARQAGERPSPRALARVDWQLLVTNAPRDRLSLRAAAALARARWQIELLFKRWKTQGQLDQWRSMKPERVRCEVYAKLIALVLTHWLLVAGVWSNAHRSLIRATALIQRHARLLLLVLDRRRALAQALRRLLRLLAACPPLGKRKRPTIAQQLANPDCSALA